MLREAFAAGREGEPRVVMLRGEAGIGKTRLLQELLSAPDGPLGLDSTLPLHVAVGQCVDAGTIGAPFVPVRRLLRALHRSVGDDAFRAAAGSAGAISVLGAFVPELAPDASAQPDWAPDAVADAVERLIEQLSAESHLLLVMEDLHWADASTIDLLRTLAITERGSHVTIVCTYRSDDIARGHPLHALLAELDRSRAVTTLELARLGDDDVAALVRDISPGAADASTAAIAQRSQGVPFFVEELIDLGDAPLPATLRGIVLARVARLSASARDIVGALSAGGAHVDHEVLEEVTHVAGRDVDEAVREAIDAAVIVADDRGYSFRHALIQEAVHDELLPRERTALHEAFAVALQRRVDAGDLALAAETAEHWIVARDVPRAFDASVAARAHARGTLAIVASARLGERLLDLWDQVPDAAARAGSSFAELAVEVMMECNAQGDYARLSRVGRSAMRALGDDDPIGRARIHRMFAVGASNSGDDAGSLIELARSRELLEPEHGRRRDSTLALVRSMELMEDRELDRAAFAAAAEECLRLAEDACSDTEFGIVCTHVAWARWGRGDLAGALESVERARDIASDSGAATLAGSMNTRSVLVLVLFALARFRDVVETGTESLARAAELGLRGEMTDDIAVMIARAHLAQGEVEAARAALPPVMRAGRRAEPADRLPAWYGTGARLWAGEHVDLEVLTDAAAVPPSGERPSSRRIATAAEAHLAALQTTRSADQARAHAERALQILAPLSDPFYANTLGLLLDAVPVMARAIMSASRHGIDEGASALRERLAQVLDAVRDVDAGAALRAFADAELSRAKGTGDVEVLRRGVEVAREGFLHVRHRHYLELRLADALLAQGERDAAAALLAEIADAASAHGVGLVAGWARTLAAGEGIRLPRADAAARPAQGPESAFAALTSREHEVLALVAEGLTNPQIGARLYISPKTASVHVSAILAKIGAANRVEAAALYAATQSPD